MLRALFHFLIRQSESQSDKRSCKSTYDSGKKIQNQSCKQSHNCNQIRVERIRTFPFSSGSTYDSITYDLVETRLLESEEEADR